MNNEQNLDNPQNQQLNTADVIARFSNEHGWISYSEFNEWMIERGFNVTQLERHNRTDGEVHFKMIWQEIQFIACVDWMNCVFRKIYFIF